jgi:hypothetical protein
MCNSELIYYTCTTINAIHINNWAMSASMTLKYKYMSKSHCDWCSVGQSVNLGVDPIWGSWPDIYYCLKVMVLFLCGALSDERTGLSFVYAAGPCQRSLSRVWVPWDSWSYFTLWNVRFPFSSPPMTRGVTMEVFDPDSTWANNTIVI